MTTEPRLRVLVSVSDRYYYSAGSVGIGEDSRWRFYLCPTTFLCRVVEERQDGRANVRGRERRPSSTLQHCSSLRRFGVRPSSLLRYRRYIYIYIFLFSFSAGVEVVTSGEKEERESGVSRERCADRVPVVVTSRTRRNQEETTDVDQSSWHVLTFLISNLEAGYSHRDHALSFAARRCINLFQESITLRRGSIILRDSVENKK